MNKLTNIFTTIGFYTISILVLTTINVAAYSEGNSSELLIVENLHDKLLFLMKNSDSLEHEERVNEMTEVISNNFNIPLISQVVLGRHWNNLNLDEQADFVLLYTNLVATTYASRFNMFDGESFLYLTTQELNRGRKLVKTELHTSSDEIVTLEYLMAKDKNNWKIISVIANGANDISIKRGEYADVIKAKGYDALLVEINKKINESVELKN
jgi:phospholipid transport system substrate-binding protein